LQITLIASGQINHIPGGARQVLPDGVLAASRRALEITALDQKDLRKIAPFITFKTTSSTIRLIIY